MNLRSIAENFRTFSRPKLDEWTLADILTALFNQVISLEFRNDVAELLDRERLGVYSMFEFYYEASRACELHVVTVDDKLVGFATRYGKGDWTGTVLDHAQLAVVATDLAAAAIKRDVANLAPVDLTRKLDLNQHPIEFLDEDQTMFVILSPRAVYRFNEVPARHRTYFVDDAGQAQLVTSIGEFKQKGWLNGKAPSEDLVFIVVNGEEQLVDATQLLFELIPEQGNLEAALACYRRPLSWKIVRVAPAVHRVQVSARTPNRWDALQIWTQFESAEAMAQFLAQYPLDQVTPGVFDAAVLGPRGRVYQTYVAP